MCGVRRKISLSQRQVWVDWKPGLGSESGLESRWKFHRNQCTEIGEKSGWGVEVTAVDTLLQLGSQCHSAPNENPWLLWEGQPPDLSDTMVCAPTSRGHVPTY